MRETKIYGKIIENEETQMLLSQAKGKFDSIKIDRNLASRAKSLLAYVVDGPAYIKAISLAAFLYLVNPCDIIPDMVPGFGFVDDIVVVAFGLYQISKIRGVQSNNSIPVEI